MLIRKYTESQMATVSSVLILYAFLMCRFVTLSTGDTCLGRSDVIFIIDASDSVIQPAYETEKRFVKEITSQMRMNPTYGHVVGVLSYSSALNEVSLRPFKSQELLAQRVDFLNQERLGTRTDIALRRAAEMFKFEGRSFAKKVVILVTDGRSRYPNVTVQEVAMLQRLKCQIIVVGIGCNINWEELSNTATQEGSLFNIQSFDDLSSLVREILLVFCKDLVTSSTHAPFNTTDTTTLSNTTLTPSRSTESISTRTTPIPTTISESPETTNPITESVSTTAITHTTENSTTSQSTTEQSTVTTKYSTLSTLLTTLTASTIPMETTEISTTTDISPDTSTGKPDTTNDISMSSYITTEPKTPTTQTPSRPLTTVPITTTATTTMTTTIKTETTKATTEKPHQSTIDNSVCVGVILLWGVGYVPNPMDCTSYYMCVWIDAESLRAIKQTCSFGKFWDHDNHKCSSAKSVVCAADPCRGLAKPNYISTGSCAAAWLCRDRKTYSHICCKRGTLFNTLTLTCVEATWCQDDCPPQYRYDHCTRWTVSDEPAMYYESVPGHGTLKRPCASGSWFEQKTCECSRYAGGMPTLPTTTTPKPDCKPVLYLPFNNDVVKDMSGHETPIVNVGVRSIPIVESVGGNTGYLNGQSYIIIDKFRNFDFSRGMLVRLRYWELPDQNRAKNLEGLVTNAGCGKNYGSLGLGYHRRNESVVSHLNTINANNSRLSLSALGSWKDVELRYTGQLVTLLVNENERTVWSSGAVRRVDSPLYIGYGCHPEYSYFYGYIDEVYVYNCIP